MAGLKLPKPHKPFRLSKLQALLLSGGAFVLGMLAWFLATHRLVTDPAPMFNERVLGALTFVGKPAHAEAFIAQLPEEARKLLESVPPAEGTQTTIFAYQSMAGAVRWGGVAKVGRPPDTNMSTSVLDGHFTLFGFGKYRSTLSSFGDSDHFEAIALDAMRHPDDPMPKRRWIKRDVQAFGFIAVRGRREPVYASFETKHAQLEVGRSYRGLSLRPAVFGPGRRLIAPIQAQEASIEKPPGASWGEVAARFAARMQRFGILTEPWTWPGRVELAVSASATNGSLQPFVLYYRHAKSEPKAREKVDEFAKKLLAEASPEAIQVQLPDDSRMTELRHNPGSVRHQISSNRFGQLGTLTSSNSNAALTLFHADDGESWLSTSVRLIQDAMIDNIGSEVPESGCQKGWSDGFGAFSGKFFSDFGAFKTVTISVSSLETGLFTLCGYY